MGRVFDLAPLPIRFVEVFVVGDLLDHFSHCLTELLVELAQCGFGVFDRVVEKRCICSFIGHGYHPSKRVEHA
jgi:hypothetical protein